MVPLKWPAEFPVALKSRGSASTEWRSWASSLPPISGTAHRLGPRGGCLGQVFPGAHGAHARWAAGFLQVCTSRELGASLSPAFPTAWEGRDKVSSRTRCRHASCLQGAMQTLRVPGPWRQARTGAPHETPRGWSSRPRPCTCCCGPRPAPSRGGREPRPPSDWLACGRERGPLSSGPLSHRAEGCLSVFPTNGIGFCLMLACDFSVRSGGFSPLFRSHG